MKTTKTFLLGFAIVLFGCGAASCSDDDKKDNEPQNPTESPIDPQNPTESPTEPQNPTATVTKVEYTFSFEPQADQLEVFDLTAEYTDFSGNTQTEPVTGIWKKTFACEKFPSDFSLQIVRTLKTGVEYTKDSYGIGYTSDYTSEIFLSDGKSKQDQMSHFSSNLSSPKNKIDQVRPILYHTAFTVDLNEEKDNIVRTDK